MKNSARVGAAAFALGLSLAGPQALGVAHADTPDSDSASVSDAGSTGQSSPARRAARTGQEGGAATPRAAASRSGRAAATVDRGTASAQRRKDPVVQHDSSFAAPASSLRSPRPVAASRAAEAVITPNPTAEPAAAIAPASSTTAGVDVSAARSTVASATAAASPRAGAFMTALNTAVTTWFDGTASWLDSLPASPISEFLQGALLLVRRNLFNQTPTTDPNNFLISRLTGETVGNVGAVDAEGDALTYSLVKGKGPSFGTVDLAADGTYTYTPGSDYNGYDSFTVAVTDPGFNILDPFASRSTETFVEVPYWSRGATSTTGFDFYNFTGQNIVVGNVLEGTVKTGPKPATIVHPGDQIHFETGTLSTKVLVAVPAQGATPQTNWTLKMIQGFGPARVAKCDAGNCVTAGLHTQLLVDAPGTVWDFAAGDQQGEALLNALMTADESLGSPLNFALTDAKYKNATLPSDYQPTGRSSFNSDGSETSKFIASSSSTVETSSTSSWEVGTEVGKSILGIVDVAVAAKYGVSTTTTESKTFSQTQEYTTLPYSYCVIVGAAPKVNVTGDLTGTFSGAATDPGVKFIFRDFSYTLPDPSATNLLFDRFDYPYQPPGQGGVRNDKVGFIMQTAESWQDPTKPIDPTYGVGEEHALTTKAYVGATVASPEIYTRQATYTSSDPTVATVSASGALKTLSPGTATITASFEWEAPDGITGLVTSSIIVTVV